MGRLRPALARLYWATRRIPVLGAAAIRIHRSYATSHSFLYRLSKGKIGGEIAGAPLLVLWTMGRRSGKWRSSPLMYLDKDSALVVVASAGGSRSHPSWFLNLRADPDAIAEIGGDRREVKAREAGPQERARLWPELLSLYWGWGEYQRRTDREFPIVLLEPRSR